MKNLTHLLLRQLGVVITRARNVDPGIRLGIARMNVIRILGIGQVLDIGANSGQWATEVLKAGFKGTLTSFEPTSLAFAKLEKNSLRYKNWNIFNIAIGETEGERKINIASNDALSSSFLQMGREHSIAAPHANYIFAEKVRMSTLNKFMLDEERYFLKIDTQGYEYEILKSIPTPLWKTISAIEVEVSLVQAYEDSQLAEQIISYMRDRGFRPYRVENGLARIAFGQQVQLDIIFVQETLSSQLP